VLLVTETCEKLSFVWVMTTGRTLPRSSKYPQHLTTLLSITDMDISVSLQNGFEHLTAMYV
jgi:hypothetical protein